jgi:hypothetical protein
MDRATVVPSLLQGRPCLDPAVVHRVTAANRDRRDHYCDPSERFVVAVGAHEEAHALDQALSDPTESVAARPNDFVAAAAAAAAGVRRVHLTWDWEDCSRVGISIREEDIVVVVVAGRAVEAVAADLGEVVDREAASAVIDPGLGVAVPIYPDSTAEDSFVAEEVLAVAAAEGIRTAGLHIRVAAVDFLVSHRCCRRCQSWNNRWQLSHSTRTPSQAFFWLGPTNLDKGRFRDNALVTLPDHHTSLRTCTFGRNGLPGIACIGHDSIARRR